MMATDSSLPSPSTTWSAPEELNLPKQLADGCRVVLTPFASLRLTVVLFAMAIFIIFVGTLAQVDMDMWEVIAVYFRSWYAWIDLQVFFPRTWFPGLADKVPGGFPFPGGFAVGLLMALNLLAAHLVRFKIQASGPTLLLGLAVLAVGAVVTYLVIDSGHNKDGLQGLPSFSWESLWLLLKSSLALVAVASGLGVALANRPSRAQSVSLLAVAVISGGLASWLFAKGNSAMPSPSSLRIMWQLMQASMAAVISLIGCVLVFKKRGGVVLLHAGIGLMMFSEFFVSEYAVEGRMTIREGETVNFVRDIREVELAVVDRTDADHDIVVSVPESELKPGASIQHEHLPFDIDVDSFLNNADLREVTSSDENFANQGTGTKYVAVEVRAASGTDGGQVDMAAAYVEFKKKGSDQSLGRYLLSQILSATDRAEPVEVDGKTYDVYLRFKHTYKPYRMALKDVRKDDYLGTNTPMNYSSDIRLVDEARGIDREFKIWMNNPLRYAGETFYQSGYNVDRSGQEITDLQVVTNTGWMMPYVGCMFVTVGMFVHFSLTLVRFQGRQQREHEKGAAAQEEKETDRADSPDGFGRWAIPALVVLLCAGYVGSKLRPPAEMKAGMKIQQFGKLPVIYQGRVKPLDTLARNTLRIISNRETFVDENDVKQPAIRWLLDVISSSEEAAKHRVYRIDNLDVLETLGLKRRKGYRYAENEFVERISEFEKQVMEARELELEELSFYQRKLLEVDRRFRAARLLQLAFTPIESPQLPTDQDPDAQERFEQIRALLVRLLQKQAMLEQAEPPLTVPVGGDEEWLPHAIAWNKAFVGKIQGEAPVVATTAWTRMLTAYAQGDTKIFNETLESYQKTLDDSPPEALADAKVPFEYFFNSFQPFRHSLGLYVLSFVLVCAAWLTSAVGKFEVLNRSAFWLISFTLGLHTFALVARVLISGRPPVTNLYSSSVFIGWAAVFLGLVLERCFRIGVGNAIASVSGFATLLIAYALAADGDTFTVLQAVLDTQFWLATHVVCITLGYSTTFVAGLLGAIYLVAQANRWPALGKALTSMTYGTLCFAIFFSFFGTVLGGLWADDSWGRFWGWDPKENGALIIVLWNALILHARWGGIIKQRGMAMLAVVGNITTAWSWFGVNELGVGLHSYGFTEGVLRNLGLFVALQIAILLFGWAATSITGRASDDTLAAT